MNDFYSCSSVVLAHGVEVSDESGRYLLIVMGLFVFGVFLLEKFAKWPKGLFISSIISYLLISISILCITFKLRIPEMIGYPCFAAALYPYFFLFSYYAVGMGVGFYVAPFIIDTLLIFAIVRLILFIKHKFSSKKSAAVQ